MPTRTPVPGEVILSGGPEVPMAVGIWITSGRVLSEHEIRASRRTPLRTLLTPHVWLPLSLSPSSLPPLSQGSRALSFPLLPQPTPRSSNYNLGSILLCPEAGLIQVVNMHSLSWEIQGSLCPRPGLRLELLTLRPALLPEPLG